MIFQRLTGEKQVLIRWRALIFMKVCHKIALFSQKNGPKAPQDSIGAPRAIIFELPGCEDPMVGKTVYHLSAIGKQLV